MAAGVLVAAIAGVGAYRVVGPYGDGPVNVGLYRTEDPNTGAQLVYRRVPLGDGGELRYLFDDATRTLKEVRTVRQGLPDSVRTIADTTGAAAPAASKDPETGLVKFGFSLRGNGVIDAWQFRDANGRLQKIEISRQQNGVVDRWEYYKAEQLSRVEEDEDHNGRVDRWLTYDAGILVQDARDRDGDGKPDSGR